MNHSRSRRANSERRRREELPALGEQQASQRRAADGEAHGHDAVPEADLPGGHVVVEQEEREHGHRALLTCRQEGDRWWWVGGAVPCVLNVETLNRQNRSFSCSFT